MLLMETDVGVGVGVGVGMPSQACAGAPLLRGFGALTAKSAALLSVSVHPLLPRRTAAVLLGAGVLAVPSKHEAALP